MKNEEIAKLFLQVEKKSERDSEEIERLRIQSEAKDAEIVQLKHRNPQFNEEEKEIASLQMDI